MRSVPLRARNDCVTFPNLLQRKPLSNHVSKDQCDLVGVVMTTTTISPNGCSDMEQTEWLTRMETVLEVLNEGVIVTDLRHRILFANSRFLEMIVVSQHDLTDSGPSRFYSDEEWAFLMRQAELTLQAGRKSIRLCAGAKGRHPAAGHYQFADTPKQRRPVRDCELHGYLGAGPG